MEEIVSCIMPTANRHQYIPLGIKNFLEQDYPNKELIILDDGKSSVADLIPKDHRIKYSYSKTAHSIGTKRNQACELAVGTVIMHWDDDDWRANDWISRQVHYLKSSGADVCGITHVNFYETIKDTLWKGTDLNRNNPYIPNWLNGATLAYHKNFWAKNRFQDLNMAEDDIFLRYPGIKIHAHEYIDGFISILHGRNSTRKYFEIPTNRQKSENK